MDQQMAPFQPNLPTWAIPEDLRPKWSRMVSQEGNEVCTIKSPLCEIRMTYGG